MNLWADFIYIVCAYLIGALPHLQALAKICKITLEGDYHSSLTQKGGLPIGVIGILGEFIKGALPVLAGRLLDFEITIISIAGLAVVCGQMWPVFQGFDGEKGNTVALSMSASLAYQPLLIALIPIATGALIRTVNRLSRGTGQTRSFYGGQFSYSLPIAMFAGFFMLPFASWYLKEPSIITLSFFVLFGLLMLRRLTAGLKKDLQSGSDLKNILINRLFLDRGIYKFRS